MKIHHVGMLVADVAAGQALIEKFLHAERQSEPIDDPLQSATVQFFSAGGVTIELIAPLGEKSHLRNVLSRAGEHLAHLCYETPDLDGEIARMRQAGALLISRKPAVAFGGRQVAFLFLPNKMVVELLAAS